MRVLVTGSGGQVGSAVLGSAPAYAKVVSCSHGDLGITDEQAVMSCIRHHVPDVIVNAAAYTAVDRAESEPDLARAVNTAGPRYLATAAREIDARLVHISTDFVFDGTSSEPYRPDAICNPLSVYGATKRAGEEAVLEALPRSIILRTAWVYAAEGRNFVHTMLRVMRANGSVRVVADQVGTPTWASSLARTIWKLIEKPEVKGIHHWTDAGVASWYDFAVAIAEEAIEIGLLSSEVNVIPISTQEYPTVARRPSYSVLSTSSMRAIGIAPVHWRKHLRIVLEEIENA